jgi:TetR/AcrR family transcriptional repressor of nem operon
VADYLSAEHRDNPRDGCPLAALGAELARADTQTRAAATAGFLKLVNALAGGFDEGTPDEARRRAMVAALTLIGALTVSRVVTDQALSDAILRSAQDSITGSQTTGGKKAKRGG